MNGHTGTESRTGTGSFGHGPTTPVRPRTHDGPVRGRAGESPQDDERIPGFSRVPAERSSFEETPRRGPGPPHPKPGDGVTP
ncbi:hypothetical protein GA0115234_1042132 [Streptomyces sp. DvalAA-43]|nr:hypothetical protein GA0115234_1042132 [Streptomyces sp. DvalAA-43]